MQLDKLLRHIHDEIYGISYLVPSSVYISYVNHFYQLIISQSSEYCRAYFNIATVFGKEQPVVKVVDKMVQFQ
jgi:hypothetical protein